MSQYGETRRMSQQKPKTQRKMTATKNYTDHLQGVPEWLEEIEDSLADESVPEHRDASGSSHELPLKPRANVVSGKRTAFLPTSRKTEIWTSA